MACPHVPAVSHAWSRLGAAPSPAIEAIHKQDLRLEPFLLFPHPSHRSEVLEPLDPCNILLLPLPCPPSTPPNTKMSERLSLSLPCPRGSPSGPCVPEVSPHPPATDDDFILPLGPAAPSPQTLLGLADACSPSAGIAGGHQVRATHSPLPLLATQSPRGRG